MLTTKQKRALHVAARAAGVEDPERHIVQRNVGGFHSAADRTASQEGFVAVMAFYEARCGGTMPGYTRGYWTDRDAKANPTDRLIWRIREEARARNLTEEKLDQFLAGRHMSNGLYSTVAEAPAHWLRKLLQGLIEIRRRSERKEAV